MQTLFFAGFATPEEQRDPAAQALLGRVRYLNGGLFLKHQIEQQHAAIAVPDAVFQHIFDLFAAYDWSLDDTAGGNEKEINPAVLGYIFEKYINQKAFGAYYTRTEITEYLCEQTIHRLLLDAVNAALPPNARPYDAIGDLLLKPTPTQLRLLLRQILPDLRLIDPACGSGAFLVAAMRTLIEVYSALFGKAKFSGDAELAGWVAQIERQHPNIDYFIKKQIITNNLFGVDIMAEATEIARLRLFLALVASANRVEDLEPLPNIDFNVLPGNALIGLLRVDEARADATLRQRGKDGSEAEQLGLFADDKRENYRQLVAEKNRLVAAYRNAAEWKDEASAPGIQALRDEIQRHRAQAAALLDELLLDDFQALGIRYEQATWDATKGKPGKPRRRPLTLDDMRALQPFHWGYEFDEVMNERGGFDAIITNPPWETFESNAKEFFSEYSSSITKKKMDIKEFSESLKIILKDEKTKSSWLEYQGKFPHQRDFFRLSSQYINQVPIINGSRHGKDVNLFKLFVEQCFNLLRRQGQCGIVIPSGIYSDLGAKALREMLFNNTRITGLFGFENRKAIFEGVDSRFKFVVLTFEKGGSSTTFPVAFMRHDVADLDLFPSPADLEISLDLIRQSSPDSLSITEFKSALDVHIQLKMLKFPLLGEHLDESWNLELHREFNMTDDEALFHKEKQADMLPLYEGKMIFQFTHLLAKPRYWIYVDEGRRAILGKRQTDIGQILGYQIYRFAYRSIASNTNERSFICTVIPPTFTGHSLNVSETVQGKNLLACVGMTNSFVVDWLLRQKVTTNITMFYIYQLPVPRLTEQDAAFAPIVERTAKLICTTPEYDALASEVGLGSHAAGVTDEAARAQLRAELDAMVAQLYGLTEEELTHILGSFPLVAQAQKDAVLTEFRRRAPQPDDAQVAALIAAGESDAVEFKESAVWNAHTAKKDGTLTEPIVKAVAAFLNDRAGGSVFIGVNATWQIVGIAADIAAASPKRDVDSYERAVRTALSARLGGHNSPYYRFSFHHVGAQQVLRIAVSPAPAPVYVDGELYIRDGGGKKKLSAQEALAYVARRWSS